MRNTRKFWERAFCALALPASFLRLAAPLAPMEPSLIETTAPVVETQVIAPSCPGGMCPAQLAPQVLWDFGQDSSVGDFLQPNPAVVRVKNAVGGNASFGQGATSLGSGTVVDVDGGAGLVLSCAHLFRDGIGAASVLLSSGQELPATVIEIDRQYDLSALRIEMPALANQIHAPIAGQFSPPGEAVASCGYGEIGRYRSLTGRVLGYARMRGTAAAQTIVVSGHARSGDSSGPIFNSAGQLTGVL